MVDTSGLGPDGISPVWVRVPPAVPFILYENQNRKGKLLNNGFTEPVILEDSKFGFPTIKI